MLPAVPRLVDGPGDELLSRPALAEDQHGAAESGHLPDQLEHFLHLRVLADDVPEFVSAAQLPAQVAVLALDLPDGEDALGQEGRLLGVERLDEIVMGTLLHRRDRRVHRGVGRHDDDARLRPERADLAKRVDAVHATRHLQIHEADREVRGSHGFDSPPVR